MNNLSKRFDEHCLTLLKKMREFEEEFFCKKCNTSECIHLKKQMNKKFEKEIEENLELVKELAKETFGFKGVV